MGNTASAGIGLLFVIGLHDTQPAIETPPPPYRSTTTMDIAIMGPMVWICQNRIEVVGSLYVVPLGGLLTGSRRLGGREGAAGYCGYVSDKDHLIG